MAANIDVDTANKIELINKKIEEINQRRYGLRTTRVEDELDRQELDEYINTLHLTSEQKSLIDGFNRGNTRPVQNQGVFYYGMMIVSVFVEAYLGYAIAELLLKPGPGTGNTIFDTLYLYLMIAVFVINAFYILRFMRILK
jgi:hypothetical protein